jgi:hypothetical protein
MVGLSEHVEHRTALLGVAIEDATQHVGREAIGKGLRALPTEPQDTQLFRCKLFFPGITQVTADFAILSHLKEPHEVVIGCDILHSARLIVDFTTGQWELRFLDFEFSIVSLASVSVAPNTAGRKTIH